MAIKCITFDLDDTLWECKPVIINAEKQMYHWFEQHYPKISAHYSFDNLIQSRNDFMTTHPELALNVTQTRLHWLEQISRQFNYPLDMVEQAFEVFIRARNEVTLYTGVEDLLSRLGNRFIIGAISNGNASVDRIGIGHFFDFSISAAEFGIAKPSAEIFHHAVQTAAVQSEETLHIGDHPETDVLGALNAGLHAIWYNPEQFEWQEKIKPSGMIKQLNELENEIERIMACF